MSRGRYRVTRLATLPRQHPKFKYEPPRDCMNAPDLYIPLMAFITFVLVTGLLKGTNMTCVALPLYRMLCDTVLPAACLSCGSAHATSRPAYACVYRWQVHARGAGGRHHSFHCHAGA